MSQRYFTNGYKYKLSDNGLTVISVLSELIELRDNYLVFCNDCHFSQSALVTLINYVATVKY